MSAWIIAAAGGLLLAALSYAGRGAPGTAVRAGLGLLRAIAALIIVALVLDAPAGRSRQSPPLVALDASLSWTRGGDRGAFQRALDSARAISRDTVWLFGDSLRAATGVPAPSDEASDARPIVDRAAAAGRAVVLLTDGELADAAVLRALPRGSRVAGVAPRRASDAALVSLAAPRFAAATDTADVRLTIGADAAGAGSGTVAVEAAGRVRAQTTFEALPAFAERTIALRVPFAGASGEVVLRAIVTAAGDGERRNDTLATTVDVSSAPAAVFVSAAPDFDARALLGMLRGALSVPTRAFLRVAPGQWRVEGTLAPVPESEVRQAAGAAGILVLHGDTTLFGPTRGVGRGALLLFPTTASGAAEGEWYASDAPPSPAAAALSSVAWDSLPPLDAGGAVPNGEFTVLRARLARSGPPRAMVTGSERPRRVVVVGAGGFWRWQFRGGAAADAFSGLWGGVVDFLAAGRGDVRAAVAADPIVRAGEPVRWRRGGRDSVVAVAITRRDAPAGPADTVHLRFGEGGEPASSRPLAAGVYDVRVSGGSSVLVVNAARELLPRRPTVTPGPVGGAARADATPRARDLAWLYALALALLCVEWLLRRRVGLR